MERLIRFDVVAHQDTLMVVVESEHLPPDPTVVIIPLLRDYPAVAYLNPLITFGSDTLVLATRLIPSVRRHPLRKVGSAAGFSDDIVRAVDVLMGSF